MTTYKEMMAKHEKEVAEFPLKFSFSKDQFAEGMAELGLKPEDTDKIVSIGCGGFIRVTDVGAYVEMLKRHEREKEEAMDGDDFLFEMFYYELGNHEYIVTYDLTDTLDACGVSQEFVDNDERFAKILNDAITQYVHDCYKNGWA